MSDSIPGEVLVAAERFLPKCECARNPMVFQCSLESFGKSKILSPRITCGTCKTHYESELLDVGLPHGQAVV